jgi:hypothetical protein
MALRVIIDPKKIAQWIQERGGTPARGPEGFAVKFADGNSNLLPVAWEDFLQAFKEQKLVMLVDDSSGSIFHKIYAHK